jgi:hypothetical protein
MSDTQDPLIVLQRRVQQRQILAMMGINQWVQPSSETVNIADISAPTITHTTNHSVASHTSVEQDSIRQLGIDDLNANMSNTDVSNVGLSNIDVLDANVLDAGILSNQSADAVSNVVDEDAINSYYHDTNDVISTSSHEQSPVTYSFDTTTPHIAPTAFVNAPVQQAAVLAEPTDFTESHHDNQLKVAPFDLQGGRYGNWVVLVDIKALNNESQKLWENITQALSITCETTSFPICEGMDTAELANASLAGYVFKIGRSEDIQVAALTALPDGLEHPNLANVATLDEMLADSSLKRQLWEQISS